MRDSICICLLSNKHHLIYAFTFVNLIAFEITARLRPISPIPTATHRDCHVLFHNVHGLPAQVDEIIDARQVIMY